MTPFDRTYVLDQSACDAAAEEIAAFCAGLKLPRREALRYRLAAEECMLFWLERADAGAQVRLCMGQRLLAPFISLELSGAPLDPYRDETGDFGPYCGGVLENLHLAPEYSYVGGCNRIYFRVRRKRLGQLPTLGLVIAASALIGILGQLLLPQPLLSALQQGIVVPVYDTFFDILSCIAGPMIFLSVAWGIYGIGDAATLGRIGKKLMLGYVGTVFLVAACAAVSLPLFGLDLSGGAGQEAQLSSIAQMLLGIFPATIIEPFATGNTLQIIFLAVVIGIALLFLGRKTSAVAVAIEQVNYLVQFLMEFISRLVPFVIFLVVLNLFWSGDLDTLGGTWRMLLISLGLCVLAAAGFLLVTAARQKVSPLLLAKKGLPTFLVALATASSAASFSSNMTVSEKKYGIAPSLCSFGIPLGMVLHAPISALYFVVTVFYFAGEYGVACSVGWVAVAVFVSAVMAIAMPPIPGGAAVAYSILFAQMGIPAEAVAVALTVDLVTDFYITAFDMFVLPLSLLNVASRMGMVDRAVLEKD
ncbi:MAG: dicarboxylate/amino acid:cation symporter [Ruminococcaceae bacterium]|nr:dicarboxylate/amino acid:cation symporter [Oscillospiraceae bacterium]